MLKHTCGHSLQFALGKHINPRGPSSGTKIFSNNLKNTETHTLPTETLIYTNLQCLYINHRQALNGTHHKLTPEDTKATQHQTKVDPDRHVTDTKGDTKEVARPHEVVAVPVNAPRRHHGPAAAAQTCGELPGGPVSSVGAGWAPVPTRNKSELCLGSAPAFSSSVGPWVRTAGGQAGVGSCRGRARTFRRLEGSPPPTPEAGHLPRPGKCWLKSGKRTLPPGHDAFVALAAPGSPRPRARCSGARLQVWPLMGRGA